MDKRLVQYRQRWQEKPVLQEIYKDYYSRIVINCISGQTLEIGGGAGNLKEYMPEVISFDILHAPWLDLVADAHRLPFKSNTFDNIVLFDVLHHLKQPKNFLNEATRILKQDGRIILLEPAITFFSWFFYNYLHHEVVDLNIDPLCDENCFTEDDPYASNQAIPTLLFKDYSEKLEKEIPLLKLDRNEYLSLFAYPLSGGFKQWTLIPAVAVKPLIKIEDKLMPFIGSKMAFRMLTILIKNI